MYTVDINKSLYHSFKRRLVIGCAAILALSIAASAWKATADYQAAIDTTIAQTNNLVLAVEAHVVSDIDMMNAPLDAVAKEIEKRSSDGQLTATEIKSILTSPLLPSTADYWFLYINAEGVGIAASKDLPVAGISYNDRDYFNAQKNSPNGQIFIGEPKIGKVSKTRNYFISKRVQSDDGEFMGVIVAVVESTPLAKVLEQFLYDNSLSTTVASNRGIIIARVPLFEQSFGSDISKSNLFVNSAKSPSGTYRTVSVVDKKNRIYSYRVFEKYPLTVSVGMLSPVLIDILWRDAAGILSGLLAILLILIFGSRYALKRFRNVGNFAKRQQQLNHQLDAAQSEIEANAKRARMIADNIPALVAYNDRDEYYQFRNSFYQHTPEIAYEAMIGHTICEVYGPDRYALIENEVARALNGESLVFERETQQQDGKQTCLRYQLVPDKNSDGVVVGFYTLVSDVTDMKAIQNQLLALTRIDALTGLPNRTALYECIEQALTRTARRNHLTASPEIIGCLFLDIDSFKSINDTYGHNTGDAVLKEFGRRLKTCIRQSDMAARLAGDEFVIFLEGLDEPDGAVSVAKKIITAMTTLFITEHGPIRVTASVGIAVSSAGNDTADSLLKAADSALYEAKKRGRNTFAVKNGQDE